MPCSKSMAHRYIMASFLAGKIDVVADFDAYCEDLDATKKCLISIHNNKNIVNCGDSGTTFRFLTALLPALGVEAEIRIGEGLSKRPIAELIDELNNHGAKINKLSDCSYRISGKLKPGKYEIPGNISSQYISALLFALPLLDGDSKIVISNEIESRPYIDLTLQTLDVFGIDYQELNNAFKIYGNQEYKYGDEAKELLEGDWSIGAMWLVASKLLGDTISVSGLNEDSNQADAMIQDLLEIEDGLDVFISIQDCPDLAPAIALWGAGRKANTKMTDTERLKLKESDRLKAIESVMAELGTDNVINTFNDHRIVMLAALGSIITDKPVTIDSPESVNKSYPNFFKEIEKLGGIIEWN